MHCGITENYIYIALNDVAIHLVDLDTDGEPNHVCFDIFQRFCCYFVFCFLDFKLNFVTIRTHLITYLKDGKHIQDILSHIITHVS